MLNLNEFRRNHHPSGVKMLANSFRRKMRVLHCLSIIQRGKDDLSVIEHCDGFIRGIGLVQYERSLFELDNSALRLIRFNPTYLHSRLAKVPNHNGRGLIISSISCTRLLSI